MISKILEYICEDGFLFLCSSRKLIAKTVARDRRVKTTLYNETEPNKFRYASIVCIGIAFQANTALKLGNHIVE